MYYRLNKGIYHTFISLISALYIFYSIYIYIYKIHFWAKIVRFHIKSWTEWDSNPQTWAYRTHALTTELSGRIMIIILLV